MKPDELREMNDSLNMDALERDDDGCTICPKCDGRQWRAVKNLSLGPGVYEVRCDKCNGLGWVESEDPVRP